MLNTKDLFHTTIAVILLLSVGAGQVPTASPSAKNGSKVWIGHYAEYEEFLRNAVVDRTVVIGQVFDDKELPVGAATRVFFKPGGLATSAAVKPHATKLEIAGYRLDRVLGLDMVPPTVEARYNGEMTGLQLWVLNCRPLPELKQKNLHAPDPVKWAYQLNRLYAFEDLVARIQGSPRVDPNPLVDPQWNLIVVDTSLAFTNNLALPYEIGKDLNQIDRSFFDRIKALDKTTVQRAIGDLVNADAIDALFVRRDHIVKAFEKLAEQKGTNQVFTR